MRFFQGSLSGGASVDPGKPGLKIVKAIDRDPCPVEAASPGVCSDVSNGELVANKVFSTGKALIENLQEAPRLGDETVDGELVVVTSGRGDPLEVHGLPHDWSDARHLEHEPLQRLRLEFRVRRQELLVLLGEVNQDCPALEDREIVIPTIDDRGDTTVRIELHVPLFLLFFLTEGNFPQVVVDAELLEHDEWFPAWGTSCQLAGP
mmetsp:Transcript_9034/g.22905  ORF Transcript_9034/g.22905 Transcript_9034/m.22905 type:complete len:206 (-) Transcript_9034:157-774(-)